MPATPLSPAKLPSAIPKVINAFFVVHVIRHEEIIRIISAREATGDERRQYENT